MDSQLWPPTFSGVSTSFHHDTFLTRNYLWTRHDFSVDDLEPVIPTWTPQQCREQCSLKKTAGFSSSLLQCREIYKGMKCSVVHHAGQQTDWGPNLQLLDVVKKNKSHGSDCLHCSCTCPKETDQFGFLVLRCMQQTRTQEEGLSIPLRTVRRLRPVCEVHAEYGIESCFLTWFLLVMCFFDLLT